MLDQEAVIKTYAQDARSAFHQRSRRLRVCTEQEEVKPKDVEEEMLHNKRRKEDSNNLATRFPHKIHEQQLWISQIKHIFTNGSFSSRPEQSASYLNQLQATGNDQ